MNDLIERDLQHIWHPCSQMKDYEQFPPIIVRKAVGPYLHLANGQKIIDAISSWWCKSLGHGHPALKQALRQQLDQFEHVILANTTHEAIVQLSERLAGLTENLKKVFYASDGSCAIEIAMKMSLHAHQLMGESKRNRFMALENAYHGETSLALSVSDVGIYRDPYQSILIDTIFLKNIPYVANSSDPVWHNCADYWPAIEQQLEQHAATLTAILVEPIVQGAGGMRIYSQDFLKRLRAWTKQNHIHLIADEIMTGLGRTGLPLACQHANIEPDFLCLGKGLTAGFLPLSAVLTSNLIYDLFYDDYAAGKSFLHSHTYSGNALAINVALATLQTLAQENIYQTVQENAALLHELMLEVANHTQQLTNIRNIGAIVAADLKSFKAQPRMGFLVSQQAIKLGALLRPLGSTLYWLPPLNTPAAVLRRLKAITQATLYSVCSL